MAVVTHLALIFSMLQLISLNANGLRTATKTTSILTSLVFDVLCIQETKWDEQEMTTKRGCWKGELYVSNGVNGNGGVAMYVREGKLTNVNLIYKDKLGRMLVVDCIYEGVVIRIINVYASNLEKERIIFFRELKKWCTSSTVIVWRF